MSEHLLQTILVVIFLLVLGSVILVMILKAIRLMMEHYRTKRRQLIQPPLMAFLCGDDAAFKTLREKTRSTDRALLVLSLMESAENFAGELRPRIRYACEQLGFLKEYLHRIKSWRWWVRAEAAYRLGLMGSSRAEPYLITALNDPIPEVRLMAIRSLAALQGGLALKPILRDFKDISGWGLLELSDIVLRLGPVCVPILLEALNGSWSRASLVAIDLLGQLKDSRAVPDLIRCLASPDKETRIRVVKALGLIADAEAIPSICHTMNDPSWEVRLMVCSAIGQAGGPNNIPVLVHLLNDEVKRVRVEAAEALIQLGEPGRAALRRASMGPDAFTRHVANQLLRPMASPPMIELP